MDGRSAAATLGVGQGATRDEIRRAFRARAKLLHPDTGPAGSMESFIALRLAFDRLMAEAPPAGPAGRRSGPFEAGEAAPRRPTGTIDLTDVVRRRPRRPERPMMPSGPGPEQRDARGLSFADHLTAALART